MNKLDPWILDDEQTYHMPSDVEEALEQDHNDINDGIGRGDNGGVVRRAVAAMNARSGGVGAGVGWDDDNEKAARSKTKRMDTNTTVPLTSLMPQAPTPYGRSSTMERYMQNSSSNNYLQHSNGRRSDTTKPSSSSSSRPAAASNGTLRKENMSDYNRHNNNKDAPGFVAISSSRDDIVSGDGSSIDSYYAGGDTTTSNTFTGTNINNDASSTAPSSSPPNSEVSLGGSSYESRYNMNQRNNNSYLAFFRSPTNTTTTTTQNHHLHHQPSPPPVALGSSLYNKNNNNNLSPYRLRHELSLHRSHVQQQQSACKDTTNTPQAVSPYQHYHSSSSRPTAPVEPHSSSSHNNNHHHINKPAPRFIASLPEPTDFSAITTEDRSSSHHLSKSVGVGGVKMTRAVTTKTTTTMTRLDAATATAASNLLLSPSSTSTQSPMPTPPSIGVGGPTTTTTKQTTTTTTPLKGILRSSRDRKATAIKEGDEKEEEDITIDGEDSILGERCYPTSKGGGATDTEEEEDSSYLMASLNDDDNEIIEMAYKEERRRHAKRQARRVQIMSPPAVAAAGAGNPRSPVSSAGPVLLLSPQTQPTTIAEEESAEDEDDRWAASLKPSSAIKHNQWGSSAAAWKQKQEDPLPELSSSNRNSYKPRSPVSAASPTQTEAGQAPSDSYDDYGRGGVEVVPHHSHHHDQRRMISMGQMCVTSPGRSITSSQATSPTAAMFKRTTTNPLSCQANAAKTSVLAESSPASQTSNLVGESFVTLMPARSLTPSNDSSIEEINDENDAHANVNHRNSSTGNKQRIINFQNLCSVPSKEPASTKFGAVMCSAPSNDQETAEFGICTANHSGQESFSSSEESEEEGVGEEIYSPDGSSVSKSMAMSPVALSLPTSRRRHVHKLASPEEDSLTKNSMCDNNLRSPSISVSGSLFQQQPHVTPWRRRLDGVQNRAASILVGISGQINKVQAGAANMYRGAVQGSTNPKAVLGRSLTASATRGAANLHSVPLSPVRRPNGRRRSHADEDLNDLMERHRQKVQQLAQCPSDQQAGARPLQDEQFDFCLVLQPQEAYAFWAGLLDFRVEILGEEAVNAMEKGCETMRTVNEAIPAVSTASSDTSGNENLNSILEVNDEDESERSQVNSSRRSEEDGDYSLMSMLTPRCNVGLYNRRTHSTVKKTPMTPLPVHPQYPSSSSKLAAPSPGLCGASMLSFQSGARQSVFERAIFANTLGMIGPSPCLEPGDESLSLATEAAAPPCSLPFGLNSSTQQRIKWGNHANTNANQHSAKKPTTFYNSSQQNNDNQQLNATVTSAETPQVRSVKNEGHSTRPLSRETGKDSQPDVVAKVSSGRNRDPNVIELQDIPTQVIPRGIAARTNGMVPFLNGLNGRGIVVQRHRPGQEALFYRIYSEDRGDTIQYQIVDKQEEAMEAFTAQREKYNKRAISSSMGSENVDPQFQKLNAAPWSYDASKKNDSKGTVAAGAAVSHALKAAIRRGSVRTADIVAIHPARHQDPRSEEGEKGTLTLRRSKSDYVEERTFSIAYRSGQNILRGHSASLDEVENRWYKGEGNDSQFKYLDFEAATEGEYWLLFRGFLLLHRDAAVGRFAEQRAAGIGSHYCRLEGELSDQIDGGERNRLHNDEFHEPVTVGCMERLIVKLRKQDDTYMKGFTLPGAVPPPSDFFLGFRTPGTAIWSRLRYAGLTTQRVYSLDPRQVIIKVSCPSYRLMDVAEVLRVKLKTCDGSFAPFRQDMIDIFQPVDDPLEQCSSQHPSEFQFRSCVRQAIIDFIIRSRIRDSGAELGEATVKRPSGLDSLGKMIQARVPLHMHGKLNAIYNVWFYFWRENSWEGRDGRSLSHESTAGGKEKPDDSLSITTGESTDGVSMGAVYTSDLGRDKMPPWYKRFFVGSLHQPLDSIEEYFGEKVAFYFAWLQHTAGHLVFLSVAGLIVFICQVASLSWDHPLRPVFATVVMLWTFVVLIDWRKRANFLAYRWGTLNYKEQEVTRPQFQGEFVKDEITGEDVLRYPKWKRSLKYAISLPVTIMFTICTLIVILWVHANRDLQLARYIETTTNPGSEKFQFEFAISAIGKRAPIVEMKLTQEQFLDINFWFIVVGMPALLGLFLPLLNFVLMRLSIALNDFENYRTESEYRTNLIIKVFSFRFVCYFATLYYYAFVSVGTKQAIENGILRVGTGVLVYTTVAHWWQVILQIYLPLIIRKVRMHYRAIKLCNALREIEMEEDHETELDPTESRKRRVELVNKRLLLEQAQDEIWLELMRPAHDSFPEYIQAVVLFTYVTCFSVVLPITPLICLINYLVSMRLDAYKLCKGRRRPLAEKTGGIGVWEHLMHIVAVISVLTNCWLMGFTNEQFVWLGEQIGQLGLFAIVVCWEHIMLLIKYIMQTSVSPLPKSVQDAMKKEKYELDEQRNTLMRDRQQGRRTQYQHDDVNFAGDGSQQLSSLSETQSVSHSTIMTASKQSIRSLATGSNVATLEQIEGPTSFDTDRDQTMSPASTNYQPFPRRRSSDKRPTPLRLSNQTSGAVVQTPCSGLRKKGRRVELFDEELGCEDQGTLYSA